MHVVILRRASNFELLNCWNHCCWYSYQLRVMDVSNNLFHRTYDVVKRFGMFRCIIGRRCMTGRNPIDNMRLTFWKSACIVCYNIGVDNFLEFRNQQNGCLKFLYSVSVSGSELLSTPLTLCCQIKMFINILYASRVHADCQTTRNNSPSVRKI